MFWPESLHIPLLRASFLSGTAGLQAWESWKSRVNMEDHPDLGSFRLLPQLHHNLQNLGVDDPLTMKLKGIARKNWYKNQRFFGSVGPLLETLYKSGIECMLLDGPAIALKYHSDYALGSDAALPIFIPRKNAAQAIKQLRLLGWQPEKLLPEELMEPYLSAGWMHIFQGSANREIRLHWRLLPGYQTTNVEADFWEGAQKTKVHNVPVHILNPADQILHGCIENSSTPRPSLFLQAIDTMLIINAVPDLDWQRLFTQAGKHHADIPLLAVLQFIQANLDEPIPPGIWLQFQGLSISNRDRFDHKRRTSGPPLIRRMWQVWFDHRYRSESASVWRNIITLPRHLQQYWRLPSLRLVPIRAWTTLRQRLLRKFQPPDRQ